MATKKSKTSRKKTTFGYTWIGGQVFGKAGWSASLYVDGKHIYDGSVQPTKAKARAAVLRESKSLMAKRNPDLPEFRIKTSSGYSYVTAMSPSTTLKKAKDYFLGKYINIGSGDRDKMEKVTSVTQVRGGYGVDPTAETHRPGMATTQILRPVRPRKGPLARNPSQSLREQAAEEYSRRYPRRKSGYGEGIILGNYRLSGADLKGKAKQYGSTYAQYRSDALAIASQFGGYETSTKKGMRVLKFPDEATNPKRKKRQTKKRK